MVYRPGRRSEATLPTMVDGGPARIDQRALLDPAGLAAASPSACRAVDQFRLLSTRARCLIHGIMARSFSPMSSIGWAAILARMALNEVWFTRFSSIQSLANLPDWMSVRMRFISARVSPVTTRGPDTYSPYSAVLETE